VNTLTMTALARALGISRTMLYRLRDRGMPTYSVEAATAWRRRNLDPGRTKRYRIDGNPGTKPRREPSPYYYVRDDGAPFGTRRVWRK
jgi:hypothetical protein